MTDLFAVAGKRVLVTGASHGIGAMIATGFAGAGADVVVTGRDEDALSRLAGALGATAVTADLSTEDGCRALADAVGRLDVLVNNAGASRKVPLEDLDDDAWDEVLAVNVKAVSHLTRFLLAALRDGATPEQPARVVNIGSISGERPGNLDNYPYTASKAALHHLTRHLARRLAPLVTVNAIAPGPFETGLTAGLLDGVDRAVPMRRIGAPGDIAAAAIYLSSPAASWVTGSILTVDGGLSLT